MSALGPPVNQPPVPQAITTPDASGRVWPADLVAAGYNQLQLGPIPSAQSKLIGEHDMPAGRFTVAYLERGPSANPELEVTLPSGAKVTVLDEASAQMYLDG